MEQACISLGAALKDIQSGIDGFVDGVEDAKLSAPLTCICDAVHALDNRTTDLTAWQEQVTQQLTKVLARLESLRSMIQELQESVPARAGKMPDPPES